MSRVPLALGALLVWALSVGSAALGTSDPLRRIGIEVIGISAALVGIVAARGLEPERS